ncbi:hypothetical protein DFH06DRAFT_1328274 [Mycena polygramma]|nr:hypothetical protein DFH06DRAFT_1328274 [Mycena polygramma]
MPLTLPVPRSSSPFRLPSHPRSRPIPTPVPFSLPSRPRSRSRYRPPPALLIPLQPLRLDLSTDRPPTDILSPARLCCAFNAAPSASGKRYVLESLVGLGLSILHRRSCRQTTVSTAGVMNHEWACEWRKACAFTYTYLRLHEGDDRETDIWLRCVPVSFTYAFPRLSLSPPPNALRSLLFYLSDSPLPPVSSFLSRCYLSSSISPFADQLLADICLAGARHLTGGAVLEMQGGSACIPKRRARRLWTLANRTLAFPSASTHGFFFLAKVLPFGYRRTSTMAGSACSRAAGPGLTEWAKVRASCVLGSERGWNRPYVRPRLPAFYPFPQFVTLSPRNIFSPSPLHSLCASRFSNADAALTDNFLFWTIPPLRRSQQPVLPGISPSARMFLDLVGATARARLSLIDHFVDVLIGTPYPAFGRSRRRRGPALLPLRSAVLDLVGATARARFSPSVDFVDVVPDTHVPPLVVLDNDLASALAAPPGPCSERWKLWIGASLRGAYSVLTALVRAEGILDIVRFGAGVEFVIGASSSSDVFHIPPPICHFARSPISSNADAALEDISFFGHTRPSSFSTTANPCAYSSQQPVIWTSSAPPPALIWRPASISSTSSSTHHAMPRLVLDNGQPVRCALRPGC